MLSTCGITASGWLTSMLYLPWRLISFLQNSILGAPGIFFPKTSGHLAPGCINTDSSDSISEPWELLNCISPGVQLWLVSPAVLSVDGQLFLSHLHAMPLELPQVVRFEITGWPARLHSRLVPSRDAANFRGLVLGCIGCIEANSNTPRITFLSKFERKFIIIIIYLFWMFSEIALFLQQYYVVYVVVVVVCRTCYIYF